MKKQIEIVLQPHEVSSREHLLSAAARCLKIPKEEITAVAQRHRSLDARAKHPVYRVSADVFIGEEPEQAAPQVQYRHASGPKKVIIVGSGPAGLFAALRLLESGVKPIVFERGKDVQERRRDLRAVQQFHTVDPDSNYCFGEGGAGTYSDGKLYTRSNKRGSIDKILQVLAGHGATPDICIDAHPHIGSNKLPAIVQTIRENIIAHGGEVHFLSRVTDFLIKENSIFGVIVNGSEEHTADAVILATGHSARDIYTLLYSRHIEIEAKSFAVGVRIEHPQALIDEMQYHSKVRNPHLPAASYSLACQVEDRGVFSFCMCPGGIIIPASTAPGELVLNGMSVSRRDSPFANSGLVVTVQEEDLLPYESFGVFKGMQYQAEIEKKAWEAGGKTQCAPAQRAVDFIKGQLSDSLPKTSYIPGTVSAPLQSVFPQGITERLKGALTEFNKKRKGYLSGEAVLLASETRTSAPIRVVRSSETKMHVRMQGLFPAGEGAGYAGGIVSAAMDGESSAEAVLRYLNS